jgi:hypothetical protein
LDDQAKKGFELAPWIPLRLDGICERLRGAETPEGFIEDCPV